MNQGVQNESSLSSGPKIDQDGTGNMLGRWDFVIAGPFELALVASVVETITPGVCSLGMVSWDSAPVPKEAGT